MRIASPANGVSVASGEDGLLIKIAICGNDPIVEYGWIFDHDINGGGYYRDNDAALTSNGLDSFSDRPIGNPGDVNVRYEVVLVRANDACNAAIEAISPDADDTYYVNELPAMCNNTQRISVYVSW